MNNTKLGLSALGVFTFLTIMGLQAKIWPAPSEVMADDTQAVQEDKQALEATKEDEKTIITYSGEPRNDRKFIKVKISYYNPALGGVNCFTFKNGKCVSRLANGEDWEKYIDTNNVIACPREMKFGTKIKVLGNTYECKDRGSKIVKTENEEYWIDVLGRKSIAAYGTVVKGEIVK